MAMEPELKAIQDINRILKNLCQTVSVCARKRVLKYVYDVWVEIDDGICPACQEEEDGHLTSSIAEASRQLAEGLGNEGTK